MQQRFEEEIFIKILQEGVAAHKSGKFGEAEEKYTSILKIKQNHSEANHNIGVLYFSQLKLDKAFVHLESAIKENPEISKFWLSIISAYQKILKFDNAAKFIQDWKQYVDDTSLISRLARENTELSKSRSSALKFWNSNESLFHDLQNLFTVKDYPRLKALYLKRVPNSFKTEIDLNLIGTAQLSEGKIGEAIKTLKNAIGVKFDNASAHNNLGSAYQRQNRLSEALLSLTRAINLNPALKEAHYNIGMICKMNNDFEKAIKSFFTAVSIDKNFTKAYSGLGDCLKHVRFTSYVPNLSQTIEQLIAQKNIVSPIEIAPAIISLVKNNNTLRSALTSLKQCKTKQEFSDILKILSKQTLFFNLIRISSIPDIELEENIKSLRSQFLNYIFEIDLTCEEIFIIESLILHCFTNEYVYHINANENRSLKKILQTLNSEKEAIKFDDRRILISMLFVPIQSKSWMRSVIPTKYFYKCFTKLITEPSEERKLKKTIPSVGIVNGCVSKLVANQYENAPYPRWINYQKCTKKTSLLGLCKSLEFNFKIEPKDSSISILVAGAGTGKHIMETASRFKYKKLIGIDLSKNSLSYAKRKANEEFAENIEFLHCDILETKYINKKFDLIECVGVLHHMEDPYQGWSCLVDQLKVGGLMKIGLYSRLARKHITQIRNEISNRNIGFSDLALKKFRNELIGSEKSHHKLIIDSSDFYSLSSFRDLLFNVQEHQFNFLEIDKMLDSLDLKFLGLDNKKITDDFKTAFPQKNSEENLKNWHKYETERPLSFSRMYQFWCQKISKVN